MKKIIITGATSGIGKSCAHKMASKGHHVILACRNLKKAEAVKSEIIGAFPSAVVDIKTIDLANFSSIRLFADDMIKNYDYIDVLLNNAGVFADKKGKTADGYEVTIGTNFLGQILLTELVLPLIKKSESGRIVHVSSEAGLFGKIKIKAHMFTKGPGGFIAYSKSKLAQIMYNIDLADKLAGSSITVNAVHPGKVATNIWQGDSLMMRIMGPMNMKKYMRPDEAAKICVAVSLSEKYDGITGKLFRAQGQMTYNERCLDEKTRKALMALAYTELGLV